jgi:hypothetical protein
MTEFMFVKWSAKYLVIGPRDLVGGDPAPGVWAECESQDAARSLVRVLKDDVKRRSAQ